MTGSSDVRNGSGAVLRLRPLSARSGRSTLRDLLKRQMPRNHPGEVEHTAFFNQHLGARFQTAGLRVQFHYNQVPGIHFKVDPPGEYADAILRGLRHALDRYFPTFPSIGNVWINEVIIDEVSSSQAAFYRVALLVIHQALALVEIMEADAHPSAPPRA